MTPPSRRLTLLLSTALFVTVQARADEPAKQPLAIADLYRFDGPSALQLSPDEKKAVYVRQWIDADTKQRRQALWLVEDKPTNTRALENDQPDARSPLFSPDGRWIAFLSTRPRPEGWKKTPSVPQASDPACDLWLISVDGSRLLPLAGPDKPYGRVFDDGFYGRAAFSADGRRLVFIADDGQDPRTPEEKENGVEIVRPDQGEGYTGYGAAQVWIAHLDDKPERCAASRIERLTKDDVWYGDPQWSPDGKFLVVHANKSDDRESVRYSINKNFDIWAIDAQTGVQKQLTTGPGPEVSPRIAADGKRIICLSVPRKGGHREVFNFLLITLGDGGARSEVLFDHHGPDADKAPHHFPTFPLPEDCWDTDSAHLLYTAEVGTRTASMQLDLRTHKGSPTASRTTGSNGKDSLVIERMSKRRQLTPAGNGFLDKRHIARSEVTTWKNEGFDLEGVLTLPPESVAKPPYKLLVYPHGGPHSRAAQGFNFTVQIFAAHGYAVFEPNFRGSAGYSQKFFEADRFDLGGGDMRDLLTGIDALVQRKLVDRERQFVYGSSYGGFMTSWLVGHTHQFRAAVAMNAVTDLNTMWGLTDIQSWTEWEMGGLPWEVPAAMRRHSPTTYAANVRTPTLILHARDDRRVPLPLGRMFHQALLRRQVPTQLVIYPNEGHGIRQPRHQEDVLRRTLAWFAKLDRKQ